MLKKFTLPVTVAMIIVQLLVSVGMVIYGYDIESKILTEGVEYEMDIKLNYIAEDTVVFNTKDYYIQRSLNNNWDVVLEKDENGRMVKGLSDAYKRYNGDKPFIRATDGNIKQLSEYEVEYNGEVLAPIVDAYITFVLYKGNIEVTGVYLDNIPVEEWIATYGEAWLKEQDDVIDEIEWEE